MKYKITHRVLLAVLVVCGTTAPLSAKGSSGADFLKIGSGARTSGLGEAFVALADDMNSVGWNPAGLAEITRPTANFMHLVYLADISYQTGGMAYPLGRWGTVALSGVFLHLPAFNSTRDPLAEKGTAGDMAIGASYGIKLFRSLSLGLGTKMISRQLSGYKASSFAVDTGVIFQPVRSIRFGVSLLNLGSAVKFIEEGDSLPTSLRVGAALVNLRKGPAKAALSLEYAHYLAGDGKLGLGGECWFFSTVAVRAGYKALRDTESLALGGGLKLDKLASFTPHFDYAFVPYARDMGLTHRLSATIEMGQASSGPRPPDKLSARKGKKGVLLKWATPLDWQSVGYNIYHRKKGGEYARLNKQPIRKQNLRLGGLKPGEHDFTVTSINAAGEESGYGGYASVTMGRKRVAKKRVASRRALAAPQELQAVIQGDRVRLEWLRPDGEVTGYDVYMSKDGRRFKKITTKPRRSNYLTLGLPADKEYYFMVRANGVGGVKSPYSRKTNVSLVPGAAADGLAKAPGAFRGEAGDGRVKLQWNSPGYAVQGYHVYRLLKGQEKRLTKNPVNKTSLSLGGLKNGKEYSFYLTALGEGGEESERTETITIVPR